MRKRGYSYTIISPNNIFSIEQKIYFDLGLPYKPEANMNNFQDIEEKDVNLEFIEYNVRKFREINGL